MGIFCVCERIRFYFFVLELQLRRHLKSIVTIPYALVIGKKHWKYQSSTLFAQNPESIGTENDFSSVLGLNIRYLDLISKTFWYY